MVSVVQLRLAAAIVHAVPRSELHLVCGARERLVVSQHPAADLSPCAFRQLVVEAQRVPAARRGAGSGPAMSIDHLTLGGALQDLGGGVVRSVDLRGTEERWLATTLPWERVEERLAAWDDAERPPAGIEATIAPDATLDVALIRLTGESPDATPALDRVAAAVSAVLLVDELLVSVEAHATDAG